MSAVPLIKYPYDPTGKATSNLIVGEEHSMVGLTNKAFVLNYGPFFVNGLILRNKANGQTLQPKSQYIATQLFVDETLRTGLDICSILVVTDTTLPADLVVQVDYQVLGGEFSASVDAIQQLIDSLQIGNQPVTWADIVGKPVLFPPSPHLHDLGDIYGFEYMVAALERLTQAIYTGDSAQFQAIYQYIDHQIAEVEGDIADSNANLTNHLADYNNPHRTTATQVGLGLVSNFATATTAAAQAGTATNLFMTPALTAAAIASQVGNAFAAHIADTGNPHNTTAAQVGLGNVPNYPASTTALAQAGVDNASLMTPALTAAAIAQQALVPLAAHVNNLQNPHNTTAAQVGLGNVSNFATAANADATTGTATNLFMTPATTMAAINSAAVAPLNAHINNHNNPHVVTATQIGLGSVNNTSDAAKPISTATQNALNNKIDQGGNGRIATLWIGGDNDIQIYEYTTNGMALRVGSAAGYQFHTWDPSGNYSAPGRVYASNGFQPSDERLKEGFHDLVARPLWRVIPYEGWMWKEGVKPEGEDRNDRGNIAQKVLAASPEWVATNPRHGLEDALHINLAGLAHEMATAAGHEVDALRLIVEAQGKQIDELLAHLKG